MPDSLRADMDRRRFIVLAAAASAGAGFSLVSGSTPRDSYATVHAAIEIEDSRWIEALLRHHGWGHGSRSLAWIRG